MDFETWWKDCMGWTEYEPDPKEKALAQAAWDAAYEQGAEDSLSVAYMAGLKDASSRKLPEGYVIVPVEPTEKMIEAGEELEYLEGGYGSTCDEFYKTMIQASQEEY